MTTDPVDPLVRRTLRIGLAVAVLVVASLAGIGLRAVLTAPPPVDSEMLAVAPGGVLAADEVPAGLRPHYQAAQDHRATFETVPCFCGCQEMLGHRHLGDCFVRPDGAGLEAHALGCGVCLGEAAQVMDLLAAGVSDPDVIRSAVIDEWSDPYLNP